MGNEQIIVDALYQTDPALYNAVDGGDAWMAAIKKSGARVKLYRAYERGDHRSNLTPQQRKLLNILEDDAELNESNANYCSIVVDAMAGRLHVSEITSGDEVVDEWINGTLERNGFDSKEGEWYRGAIRDKEAFVIVDPQTAMWSSEPAYDGYSGVLAIYDDMTGLPKWACKLWAVSEPADVSTDAEDLGENKRLNVIVYQPDRITYWKAYEGGGTVEAVNRFGEGNELAWDLGLIPMVQLANKRDNYTSSGESEIRAVVPLQDIVNATLYDMQMASKLSAFKVYWAKGIGIDNDGIMPGAVVNLLLKDKQGNVLTNLSEEAARFLAAVDVGEFGTTDMSQYTNQLDKLEREISQVSSTPVYGITSMGALSGEALKQLESGLVNKVIRFQKENSQAIKLLIRMTAEIQRQFNVNQSFMGKIAAKVADFLGLQAPEQPPANIDNISVNWKSPEIIDLSTQIESMSQLRRDNPGLFPDDWYRERIGGMLGMSSAQVAEEGEKAQSQQISAMERIIGGAGNVPPV